MTPSHFGTTTGLTKGQFLVSLFKEQKRKRRTDEELAALFSQEFPGCTGFVLVKITLWMNQYNRGEIACQNGVVPTDPVMRYRDRKPFRRVCGPPAKGEEGAPEYGPRKKKKSKKHPPKGPRANQPPPTPEG
jgi:hypothetical protein